ncbi:testicular haploid expressed gene protein-like [Cebus imitator]|uniref:testicular haploid expressed gene protein-like n=1 Tax=Cebus imitator TaxID=2715852 RepID=UPI00189A3D97|nr:testicular haploid expressed gene protein-like [Cebus imitator]
MRDRAGQGLGHFNHPIGLQYSFCLNGEKSKSQSPLLLNPPDIKVQLLLWSPSQFARQSFEPGKSGVHLAASTLRRGGGSEKEPDGDPHGLQSSVYGSRRVTDPRLQDLGHAELGPEDPEEELPPEEELLETLDPKDSLSELERVLDQDAEEDIPEMRQLSISQKIPGTAVARARKKRRWRRPSELVEPRRNWQVLKDRPSVYWTERFLEDTSLTITVPEVSQRMEELSWPWRFYLEYYNSNRTTPVWPIPRSSLEYRTSPRLKELAAQKIRNNIWSMNMFEVSWVSRAAQMAVPSSRILQLSKPKAPATLLEEWDPMPKPKPRVSDYNRFLHLAMPKAQPDKFVPDQDPRWAVLDVTKKVVASPRIISLARPKGHKGLNEGYDPYYISPAALVAQVSPHLYELAITRKV